ncbi:MAG: Glucose-6-phosphate isomerase B [Deltaproteobacteria bacterium ADurb.Bin151]|nr:glucose-6-phosphate isomerase [Smithella sp.]OQB55565.1 MAG: Glucose-6-phosphate isomerase B [Deltaproteobacteria bacterium ADurb.Bin151]
METAGVSFLLGSYQSAVTNAVDKMRRSNIAARIWANDFHVWKPSPQEISNRLAWLHAPLETSANVKSIRASLEPFTNGSIEDVVLLGMGGSSLSAEVFNNIFGSAPGFPRLQILDTTDPQIIHDVAEKLNLAKTLFIVSSKSGSTLEIVSLFHYFYNLTAEKTGVSANEHFMFITDEGSPMLEQAWRLQLPYVFSNNPNIGGRYSALSLVGMIPAALIGVEIDKILQNALVVANQEKADFFSGKGDSTGCFLGAALGTLAQYGRDKLTLILPPSWGSFGDWLEQLIAESTGKEGKGILPVLNEPQMDVSSYGEDRVFVIFNHNEDDWSSWITRLASAGHPVLKVRINGFYDLGGQMFLWEMATAVASHIMGINPFDQPDVEATKKYTKQMIAQFKINQTWPETKPSLAEGDCEIYGEISGSNIFVALKNFLSSSPQNAYAGLQVYLSPSTEINEALDALRAAILRRSRMAVTVGYGPRYLHSTGQLHKGDAGRGMFIQLTGENALDVEIPDALCQRGSSLTFGQLKAAQGEADRLALMDKGRKIIRIHWKKDPVAGLKNLAENL